MEIIRLKISNVRNLQSVRLDDLTQFNVCFGSNGSGKTSLLESIYLLGLGRSFRTRSFKSVISSGEEQSIVHCTARDPANSRLMSIGVGRSRHLSPEIRIQGDKITSAAQLAKLLPLQLINSDAFTLLEGAPGFRRQYIDWGVFHVEHSYNAAWQDARRCLKQRNSLLRHGKMHAGTLKVWSKEFVEAAEKVDTLRQAYLENLRIALTKVVENVMGLESFELEYSRGWDESSDLQQALARSQRQDEKRGYTSCGPHRAELVIKSKGEVATDTLSRGQEKLLICCLKLAQAALYEQATGRRCIFLIDDLPAELDLKNTGIVCDYLASMRCQCFITCIDRDTLLNHLGFGPSSAWFHVEHGKINPV